MDTRIILPEGTVLAFEGMNVILESAIGRGSNAIVYKAHYYDAFDKGLKHHVLIKELFPYHPKGGILRGESGEIIVDESCRDSFTLHRHSFERGNRIHLEILNASPDAVGANLNTYEFNGTLYSMLGFTGGRSLEDALHTAGDETLKSAANRMLAILTALEPFHAKGLLHLDISPDNILLIGEGENERIVLIDFNSVHTIDEIVSGRGEYLSVKEGYTAPEIVNRSFYSVSEKTDLYALAAVFYRLVSGKALTLMDALKRLPPDAQDARMVKDEPETVKSMVKSILRRGLNSVPARRFSSISEMKDAFKELIDRIDCVGVTHWSLWENGRRSVEKLIKSNPFYEYIASGDSLFPIRLTVDQKNLLVSDIIPFVLSPDGESMLIQAEGGMGKTTALLKTALGASKKYSPSTPAVIYVPLGGYTASSASFIRDSILRMLRFTNESAGIQDARRQLDLLLENGVQTKDGIYPKALLLLDGLNEAAGDTKALFDEIRMLSGMQGVRMVLSSRNDSEQLSMKKSRLSLLNDEDVKEALSHKGLLLPEKTEIQLLLKMPLILSLFIQASGSEGQIRVESRDELLQKYLDALISKEISDLPEDSPEKWQLNAAVWLVLAYIAGEMKHTNGMLTHAQLLKAVSKCYKFLKSRNMRRAFPQWIGHTKEILSGAENAEEWYGLIVHSILWKRLGMLIRDENGGYRASHQVIFEYLGVKDQQNRKRLLIRRALGISAYVLLTACIVSALAFFLKDYVSFGRQEPKKKVYFEDSHAERALEQTVGAFSVFGNLYKKASAIANAANSNDQAEFIRFYDLYKDDIDNIAAGSDAQTNSVAFMKKLLDTGGNAISWSQSFFEGDLAIELIRRNEERALYYKEKLEFLYEWANEEALKDAYPEFPKLVVETLNADADMTAAMFDLVYSPHITNQGSIREIQHQKLLDMTPGVLNRTDAIPGENAKEKYENASKLFTQTQNRLGELTISISEENLIYDWYHFLDENEARLSAVDWAYSYASAFAASGEWDDLLKARAAAYAARDYIYLLPVPEMTTKLYESVDLMFSDMDSQTVVTEYDNYETVLLSDVLAIESLCEKLTYEVFMTKDFELLGKWLELQKASTGIDIKYLWYMGNYLLNTVSNETAVPDYLASFEARWPSIYALSDEWTKDQELLVDKGDEVMDEYAALVDEFEALTQTIADQFEVLNSAVRKNDYAAVNAMIFDIKNEPAEFPDANWMDFGNCTYSHLNVDQETGSITYFRCFDEITEAPNSLMLTIDSLSADELTAYLNRLDRCSITHYDFYKEADDDPDFQTLITIDSCTALLTWENGGATFYLPQPMGSLKPPLYMKNIG